jgi:uncharacterized membrane protein YdjX (TVP38/TMEM64 family)
MPRRIASFLMQNRMAIAFLIAAVGLVFAVAHFVPMDVMKQKVTQFNLWVESLGYLGPLVLAIVDAVAIVLCFPFSVGFELAAGFLFGLIPGYVNFIQFHSFRSNLILPSRSPYHSLTLKCDFLVFRVTIIAVAKVSGACLAFLMARTFLKSWVERMITSSEKFGAVYGAMKVDSFRLAVLLRLSPFPSWANNYALAISPISFRDFWLATTIASFPTIVINVYMGSFMGSLTSAVTEPTDAPKLMQYGVSLIGLISTIFVSKYIMGYIKTAVETPPKQHVEDEESR